MRSLNVKAIAAQEPPFFDPLIKQWLGVYCSTSLAEAVCIYSIVLGRMDALTASLAETKMMSAFFLKHPPLLRARSAKPLARLTTKLSRPIAHNLTTLMLQLSESFTRREPWLLWRHNHLRQDTVPVKFRITDDVEKRI